MVAYPSTADTFTNPTASDKTNSATVPHATQHANANDAIEALERKLGYSSSTSGAAVTPTTNVGDILAVSDTAGRTSWGTYGMVKIATAEATSSAVSQLNFTGIPSRFSSLLLMTRARSESTLLADNIGLQLGGGAIDTSSSYRYEQLTALGTTLNSDGGQNSSSIPIGPMPGSTGAASKFNTSVIFIHNYANSTMAKYIVGNSFAERSGTSTADLYMIQNGGVWPSTVAVDTLRVISFGGFNFGTGSVARLYGIP